MRRASLLAVPALLASLLLPAGCGGPDWEGTPVLVVGVDGMEWSVIEPLLEQGKMPHLAGLIERGVGGSLQTMVPTFSPVVWTTIATGAPPQEHGILNFGVYDAKTRQMGLPYTSNTRAVPAVWNMAGESGRSVSSVAWWVSWPAEPVPGGRVVASYAAQAQGRVLWKANVWKDGLPELTWPADLQPELRPALEDGRPGGPLSGEVVRTFGSVPPEWRFPYEREALFRNAYRSDATHVRIARELIEQDRADLNLVYFGLPDVAGHFFWRYHEPGAFQYAIPVEQVDALRGHVAKSYEVADRWLGELLEAAGPDARVLLISDHGMHAFNTGDPNMVQSGGHEDAPDGVFVLAGPGVEPRGLLPAGKRRVAHVLDITPTLLDWLDLDQPEGARGVPRRELMTAEWRAAHPERGRVDYRAGFRAPTPPREPAAGLSEEFHEGILAELGYAESLD
jgi:hypothetical protein